MLQQTRVETVIDYYTRWMQRFPTPASLAAASADDVNTAWSGLGYYRRARMLHEAAKHVQTALQGRLPNTVLGLLGIPGIGPYTAGAIASIAYHLPMPLVDGNVSRVLSRLRALRASPKNATALDLHWQLAQQLVAGDSGVDSAQSTEASDWSQALMELGAVVCMPRVAECGRCPVRRWCRAAEEVAERRRPVGDDRWTVNWKRVEVEVEMEEIQVEHGDTAKRKQEGRRERVVKGAATSRQRGGSGEQGKQSTRKQKLVDLDDTPCSVCDPQFAAPTTVLEYPSKAEKKPPTDEYVSVCVVSRRRVGGSAVEWFLVQRPAGGLLAGQWEFPAVVHPSPPASSSSSSSTARTPTAAQRRQLLADRLSMLLPAELAALVSSSARESVGELIHVFSHRRHLMHVQRCVIEEQADDATTEGESSDGRRWRWMTEGELITTGLTSGQQKVWALSRGTKVRATASSPSRKRKKVAEEKKQEPAEDAETRVGEDDGAEDEEKEGGDEEWEVWPQPAMPDAAVVHADGVIVID